MMVYGPLLALVLLGLAAAAGYAVGRASVRQQGGVDATTLAAVRREIIELRALVNRLKDIAWDQRDVDPAFSTIIIEEIREHERRELDP